MQPAPATSRLIAPPAPADIPVRRLVIALGLSAALHTTILFTTALRLQPVTPAGALFQVTLQPVPAKPSIGPAVAAGTHPKSAAATPAGNATLPAAGDLISQAGTVPTTAAAPPGRDDLHAVAPAGPERLAAETPDRFRLLALPPESATAADLHMIPIDSQLPESAVPASLVDLEYTSTTENQAVPAGRTHYRYRILENGQYRLAYRELPVGAETLAGDEERWLGEVAGDVGPDGLKPQPGDNPAGLPALGDGRLMSALLQFMYAAPGRPGTSGEMQIGDSVYRYEVVQMQAMETPYRGMLSTLQVRIQQLGLQAPAVEVWLAVDYRYLPVRIRLVDGQGIITLLRIERFTVE